MIDFHRFSAIFRDNFNDIQTILLSASVDLSDRSVFHLRLIILLPWRWQQCLRVYVARKAFFVYNVHHVVAATLSVYTWFLTIDLGLCATTPSLSSSYINSNNSSFFLTPKEEPSLSLISQFIKLFTNITSCQQQQYNNTILILGFPT